MHNAKRHLCPALAVVLVPAFFVSRLAAQQAVSGTVLGTVTDATNAVVPGASVSLRNLDTNITTTTATNDSGNYVQTQVMPGRYEITIEKTGFNRSAQKNVNVDVAQSTRVDTTLQLGEVAQELVVSAAPPGLETDRAEVTTVMESQQITEWPVLNRNFTNLTLLTPGSTKNIWQHAAAENPQTSTLVNTNGQEFSGTNYLLDGMNNNDAVLGIVMVNPPIDSVAESNVATSNYDAEFSQAGGAVVRVETKSGSNEFHGSAFEFLQNDNLEARDSFTQGLKGIPNSGIPELRWNQFGGSAGGPLIKNKVFWFGDYQGTRRRMGASETVRVPRQQIGTATSVISVFLFTTPTRETLTERGECRLAEVLFPNP